MSVGIPCAFPLKREDGSIDFSIVVCPECGEQIALSDRKDRESLSRVEYATHYEQAHEGGAS